MRRRKYTSSCAAQSCSARRGKIEILLPHRALAGSLLTLNARLTIFVIDREMRLSHIASLLETSIGLFNIS